MLPVLALRSGMLSDNIAKFVFYLIVITLDNQVSAVLRASYGVFQQEGEARGLMLAASEEVLTLCCQGNYIVFERAKTDLFSPYSKRR